MIYPTFDEEFFINSVVDWIENNDRIFLEDVFKRRRLNRTKKIDFWETNWGDMLLHPHINIASSLIAR
jgi:hypothetical protein